MGVRAAYEDYSGTVSDAVENLRLREKPSLNRAEVVAVPRGDTEEESSSMLSGTWPRTCNWSTMADLLAPSMRPSTISEAVSTARYW